MEVDLVHVETRDEVRLDGTLRTPKQGSVNQLGADVVILHHGVTGNFYSPGMFDEYSDALLEKGSAVLRVNNRGHDPINRVRVGKDLKRYGAAYEVLDESRYDWEAWIDFAQAAGYEQIGLWGHSLGAVKSIYYMAKNKDNRVKCVVAASPPRFSCSAFAAMAEGGDFKEVLSQAQQYVDAGKPDTLMDVRNPYNILITAEVYIQKYGPEEKYNILNHIPQVQVPLLIMIGTQEAQTMMAFKGLPEEVGKMAEELRNLTIESIPGSDHVYTHQREYVWNVVSRWIGGV